MSRVNTYFQTKTRAILLVLLLSSWVAFCSAAGYGSESSTTIDSPYPVALTGSLNAGDDVEVEINFTTSDPNEATEGEPLVIEDSDGFYEEISNYGAAYVVIPAVQSGDVVYAYVSGGDSDEQADITTTVNAQTDPDKDGGDPSDNQGEPEAGEPINIASGNVYDAVLDYQTAGPNKLGFTRYYNSLAGSLPNPNPIPMGPRWRTQYDPFLYIASSTSVKAERPDGQILTFTGNGSTWTSDNDVNATLSVSGATWTLATIDGKVETYKAPLTFAQEIVSNSPITATLQSIVYRGGYTQTLSYNSSKRPVTVTDSYHRTLKFAYQNNLLSAVTTPDGLVITYGYGSDGALGSVNYSTSPQTGLSYLHENAALPDDVTAVMDEDGNRYLSWTYDAQGRGLTSQFGKGANLTTIAYDDADGSRTVTSALGEIDTYRFATLQNVPKVVEIDRAATSSTPAASETFSYDTNGYLASKTDWDGNLTTYANDTLGRPTTVVEAFGGPDASGGSAPERIVYLSYYGNYDLPSQIVVPNLTSAYTYDANQNLLTKTLTDTTQTVVPYQTGGQTRTWTYTWANGLLASVTNPRTDVSEETLYAHDASGALVKTTNALGQSEQVTSHTPGGYPLVSVDANGVKTQFTYDPRLRLTSRAVQTAAGLLTTHYTYDPSGNLLTTTLPDGSATKNSYDAAHRLTGIVDLQNQKIAYVLDAAGNHIQTNVIRADGSLQSQHFDTYDALDHLTVDTGGAGQKTKYASDPNGNVLAITDPLNHVTTKTYDALNRVVSVVDPTGGHTLTSYDQQGHPKTVTAPNSGKTVYTYDGFGDVIETSSPDTHNTVYVFDADGNITEKVDASLAKVFHTYDALDRPATTMYPADASENVQFNYDEAGHGFGIGRLTSLSDAAGHLDRTYDERGNLLHETRGAGAATLSTGYGYDAASRPISTTYPDGYVVNYHRDNMGIERSITVGKSGSTVTQTVASYIEWTPFGTPSGPVRQIQFGNGITDNRLFDNDSRVTSITDSNSSGTLFANVSYGYDGANNVTSLNGTLDTTSGAHSLNQTFTYDPLNRLTYWTSPTGNIAYTYDSTGNFLTETSGSTTSSFAYAPDSNRLTSVTTNGVHDSIGYTPAGNITSLSSGPFSNVSYNEAERLAVVKSGASVVAQYTYDAFGHRLVKVLPAGKELYQYDPQGHLLEEAGGTGTPIADYIYLDNGEIAATIAPSTGSLNYILTDRLGTALSATNAAQAVVWAADYTSPFGAAAPAGAITQDLRFPGQVNDAETGFYQNGFRDYVPALGRYLESDPVGLAGGLNTYAYALDNPLKYTDPTGLCSWCPSLTEIGIAALIGVQFIPGLDVVVDLGVGGDVILGGGEIIETAGAGSEGATLLGEGAEATTAVPTPDFVVTPNGTAIPIPEGYVGRIADNENGLVYQDPDFVGVDNSNSIRVMGQYPENNPYYELYPNGYTVQYNEFNQPLTINGKPGLPADTHIPN